MASSDVGFNAGLGMRLRIMLTTVLVFGAITVIVALIMGALGITGSGSIYAWFGVSLLMLGVQWYLGPVLIKWATGAKPLSRENAPELFDIVQKLAGKARLPMPKLYIVNNPTPNAFAFGRTQSDSGIAVHSGLLSALSKDEVEGVLAHELGHINNRDVVVMTLASIIPVSLYYGVLIFGRDDNGRGSIVTIIGAFAAQFIGQLLVMWLSRQREYFADEFSARLTNNPDALMGALAKITYGASAGPKTDQGSMVKALYFAESSGSNMNAAEIAHAVRAGDEAMLASAMEQERKGGAIEILMTHPLTGKRLANLMRVKKQMGA